MSIKSENSININSHHIKIIGEKYNSRSDTFKKDCLLTEIKSSQSVDFSEIGLLTEHLEQIHLKHRPVEISVSVEVKELPHDE